MAEAAGKKKRWKDRVDTFLHGRTTDKRRARYFQPQSTESLKVVRHGEIGPRIAFISTFWPGGHALLTSFALAELLSAEVPRDLGREVPNVYARPSEGQISNFRKRIDQLASRIQSFRS